MTFVNSIAKGVNAFLGVFFNLPASVFHLISLIFAVWLILGLLRLFLGVK